MMRCLALCVAAGVATGWARADILLENARFRLAVGEDAVVRSLTLKATGEELLDLRDPTPFFAVTQPRPFNNEIKLAYPNARTTYPANRLRREGDRLVVGFEIAPYEAAVEVKVTDDYIAFTLADFILTEKSYPLCPTTTVPLDFTAPPVDEFRLVQLPVRNRANFGEWLNVLWDDAAAVGVFSTSEHALVSAERRNGYRLMNAVADRAVKLRGTGAALVVAAGGEAILDRIDALERDYGLPRGVANRRNPLVNASIYFASGFTPENADAHIAAAKRGGFRLMLISAATFFSERGDWSFNGLYPNGFADAKAVLDKIHAAGIVPGVHVLHTFLNQRSVYVKGGADRRIALREHYTLARPLGADDTEVFVDENPQNAERSPRCRILKFGKELMTYEGFTTERPYKFTGVTRGVRETPASAHEEGLIGGTVWVCEYGGEDYYLKQDSDLQDVRAEIFGAFWKAGMRFVYFDGSEGVQPPYAFHVPNAQYRMWKRLDPQPILGEGAAKAHFGWHMLSGANAFDVFAPEEFKEKIVEYPLAEAPLMRRDFTRVNFGWWGFWEPGAEIRGVRTMGVQPDMWEYGTSKAAAWDSPASVQMRLEAMSRHPRLDDVLEVMRRWEDVRAKGWLTPAQKQALRVPGDEYHLVFDERGEYDLVKLARVPSPDEIRAWSFERKGWRHILYSHTSGTGEFRVTVPDFARGQVIDVRTGAVSTFSLRREGDVFVLPAGPRRYFQYQTTAEAARPTLPSDVPELMKTSDGRAVSDRATWEAVRRPEIRETFLREIYGKRPVERPADLSFSAVEPDRVMMDGRAVRKRVRISYAGPQGASSFVVTAFVPADATAANPAPAFLLICNRDPKKNLDPERNVKSGFWPAEQIVARGYAALAFFNGDVARDHSWDFTNGVFGVFQKVEDRTPESWGILSAWAWGASRVMDWIETEPTLDARHVAVVGHSRGGKTSLLAGATDARFAMACVNDSGCGGAKLNHMDLPLSEHYEQLRIIEPWFCGNFRKYYRREHAAPFDAHWWAALLAPRLLAIASATEDHWAGQEGEFQTARLASPAWELYGQKGLVGESFPPPDTPLQEGSVSYHLRTGEHNLTPYDWDRYMDFADRHGWRRRDGGQS